MQASWIQWASWLDSAFDLEIPHATRHKRSGEILFWGMRLFLVLVQLQFPDSMTHLKSCALVETSRKVEPQLFTWKPNTFRCQLGLLGIGLAQVTLHGGKHPVKHGVLAPEQIFVLDRGLSFFEGNSPPKKKRGGGA